MKAAARALGLCALAVGASAADADERFAAAAAALRAEHGHGLFWKVDADRLEVRPGGEAHVVNWEGEARIGDDLEGLHVKTEGEYDGFRNALDHAEAQVLYSRAVKPFWDVQAGARRDFGQGRRTWAAFGVEGTAPYWVETEARLFISEDGDVAARLGLDYELLLTARLSLHPRLEWNRLLVDRNPYAAPSLRTRTPGPHIHGLAGAGHHLRQDRLEGGIRMRYAVTPQFAPYLGASRRDGRSTSLVAGFSAWF